MHDLWSRQRLVACAAIVAVLAGCAVGYNLTSFPPKSKKYEVGTAYVRVLVDTPSSQIVAVNPSGVDLLTARADLLSTLMVDGVLKTAIAQRAGLRSGQLVGTSTSAASPITSPSPPARGYVLTTTVLKGTDISNPAGDELPIIDITTQAPDAASAARLANAAVAGVQDYVSSQAISDRLPMSQRLRVTSLGPAQATEVVRGPRTMFVVVIAIFTFVVGCAVILLIPRLARDWRGAAAETDAMPDFRGPYGVPAGRDVYEERDPRRYPVPAVAHLDEARDPRSSRVPSLQESDNGRDPIPAGADEVAELKPFSAALRAVRDGGMRRPDA